MKTIKPYLFLCFIAICSCKKKDTTPSAVVAGFNFSSNSFVAPSTVTFTNTSSNATSYKWIFGDGFSSSTAANPSHLYENPGTYSVKLVATGAGGSDSITQNVAITSLVPAGTITYYINDSLITSAGVSAIRDTSFTPQAVLIKGNQLYGSGYPSISIFLQVPAGGFTGVQNINCNSSNGANYVIYANASGTIFSSTTDAKGVVVNVSKINYVQYGTVQLSFNGELTSSNNTTEQISNGIVQTQFGN